MHPTTPFNNPKTPNFPITRRTALAGIAAFATGCGGGGGSGSGSVPTGPNFTTLGLFAGDPNNAAGGYRDGTGTGALFISPGGMACDASGLVYVADGGNRRIRLMTPSGVVSTLAGSGTSGSANGTGTAASFVTPYGVAVDASGTVYVTDRDAHMIRKISPSGVVSTLAGSGSSGYTNGYGTSASFNQPYAVAVDTAGFVYVADFNNNAIRKISPMGLVSTLSGSATRASGRANGTGTAASFNGPRGVAVGPSCDVYVADTNNHLIRRISPDGVVSTWAGTGSFGNANGIGTAAAFNLPNSVALDAAGNLYVLDNNNYSIRKITPAGVVSTLVGHDLNSGFVPGPLPGNLTIPVALTANQSALYFTFANAIAKVST